MEHMNKTANNSATVKVDTTKIGAIIGRGGKTIRAITEATNTKIDIDPSGLIKVMGQDDQSLDKAISWIKTLAGHIEVGAKYTGKIKRIVDFGMFVELVPGQDGLVHISSIPAEKQNNLPQSYSINDVVTVEVVAYDPASNRIRLRLV